ncbi:hypothetical protein CERZMDRAFT_99014 [Cercospora zeae-maydis SCOH1-5]|uniref:GRF-type domain-containing protein n=1 Tax=Cercospora zeae-maydis SCOH1-5 TaxID=717836 RepID=A0A6A6FBN5_9PEZI|nr:hypothetical protein CERZMDRAFT_99014 [Cercospora zeae-maydis SCOH1-5]
MSTYRVTGSGRRRGGDGGSSSSSSRRGIGRSPGLKGLFDKLWYCDCTPRLPAEQFTVKKQGKNHGRRFYTCQQDQDKRCGFFMWSDEAQAREAQCVLSNSRDEGDSNVQEGWNAGRPRVHFAEIPKQSPSTVSHAGVKRNARDAGLMEDDYMYDEGWDLTGAEEEQLAKAADESELRTPQKPRIDGPPAAGVYATPSSETKRAPRKLPWLQEEPVTPKKGIVNYFQTPEKQTGQSTPGETPAQQQRRDESTEIEPSSPSRFSSSQRANEREVTLTEEVLQEIRSLPLPPDKMARLKSILKKHEARAEGYRKGRDISRSALKAKEKLLQAASEKIRSPEAGQDYGRRQTCSVRNARKQTTEGEDEETADEW